MFTGQRLFYRMKHTVLVLFAHPRFEDSKVNKSLLAAIQGLPGVHVHDLYEAYPDFDIDIRHEQRLLLEHDIIVWQHPLYWYSCPPLLKQWIDLVLEHGWAYGKSGQQLADKWIFNALTVGGSREVYQRGGKNEYTIGEFLRPFERTAHLCRMHYLPPFVVHHANIVTSEACHAFGAGYRELLASLSAGTQPLSYWQSQDPYLNTRQYE